MLPSFVVEFVGAVKYSKLIRINYHSATDNLSYELFSDKDNIALYIYADI